jgi:hypothetical protein
VRLPFDVGALRLETRRPLRWRAVWTLSALYVFGNLASIPLVQATQPPRLEAPSVWVLWSIANFILVAVSLYLAGRIGLGAPLLEGQLTKGERRAWARRVFALSLLIAVVASLPFFLLNRSVDLQRIPPLWTVLLASLDAGVQEEIFMRLFLVTLFAWVGGLKWRDTEGRPHSRVLWAAIVAAAIIFGWAHVDDHVMNHGMHASLARSMTINTAFGIDFGWAYWRLGFECAMLAHFLVDAVGSAIVIPIFLSGDPLLSTVVAISLILAGVGSWRLLAR